MSNQTTDQNLINFLDRHHVIEPWMRDAVNELALSREVTTIEAICDGGFVEEKTLVELFRDQLHIPEITVNGSPPALSNRDVIRTLRSHLAIPAEIRNGRLLLAMANPLDYEAVRKARFACGLPVTPAVLGLSDVRTAIERWKTEGLGQDAEALEAEEGPSPEETQEALEAAILESTSPIVRMANLLIERGVTDGASDIHFDPCAAGLIVRYRIDGVLHESNRLSPSVRTPLTARIKVMAQLDIAERRVPQDGRISIPYKGRRIDCRVSTLPTQYGEKVVMRLLDGENALIDQSHLGFEPRESEIITECLDRPEGLILTTGPTGSGKSTTLYALLNSILSPELNIVTIENPIEYRLAGINQTQINERQGMSFAAALRSILRQDPDVILVGEIRDRETAEIAIQAAQTGHLVLSTLHTNDSVGAITRLTELGVERSLLSSSLLVVIAQRLLRRICPSCKQSAPRLPEGDSLDASSTPALAAIRNEDGCDDCHHTGYRGRLGVYEIFRNTPEVKKLLESGAGEIDLRAMMQSQGGRLLSEVARGKVEAGLTTMDEVMRVIRPDDNAPGTVQAVEAPPGTTATAAPQPPAAVLPNDTEATDTNAALRSGVATVEVPKSAMAPTILGSCVRGMAVASGLDEIAATELELAVTEACHFACGDDVTSKTIRLESESFPEGHSVHLTDKGPRWPWPRLAPNVPDLDLLMAGDAPETRAFLIRSSVDESNYEHSDGVNELWLVKRCSAASTSEGTP